jgi:hypothetical protein
MWLPCQQCLSHIERCQRPVGACQLGAAWLLCRRAFSLIGWHLGTHRCGSDVMIDGCLARDPRSRPQWLWTHRRQLARQFLLFLLFYFLFLFCLQLRALYILPTAFLLTRYSGPMVTACHSIYDPKAAGSNLLIEHLLLKPIYVLCCAQFFLT